MSKLDLKKRFGDPPVVSQGPPQIQHSDQSPKAIYDAVHAWLFDPKTFPNAEKKPTMIAAPTSEALFLKPEVTAAHDDAFMPPEGSREFSHLHEDGSCHIIVSTEVEDEVLAKNWGLRHPYYERGVKEIFVYAPRNEEDIEVLKMLVQESYKYANGA
jgi:phospholipase/carboxylesterase